MKYASHILWKVIVIPFYQRHAGLFLFLFVVLFGVAQNPKSYHYQLMQSILLSPVTLLGVAIAWLLYSLKTLSFVLKTIHATENAFLRQLIQLPAGALILLCIGIQAMLLAPIWVYAAITASVGCMLHLYVPAATICLVILALWFTSGLLIRQSLLGFGLYWQLPAFPFTLPKPFFSLLVWHSFFKGKMKLAGVKLASFTALFIPLVWNAGHNNLSDFVLFLQLSVAAHALVAYDYVQFLEKEFPLLRNMPISPIRIFGLFPVAYVMLLIPETLIICYYVPETGFETNPASLMVYFIGLMLFFCSLAFEKSMSTSEYSMAVAVISVSLLFILPLTSFWIVGLALALAGFLLFLALYYKYEPEYVEDINP